MDKEAERPKRRWEAFFGRRKAKALSPKAQSRFDVLYPKIALYPEQSACHDLAVHYEPDRQNFVLEIGFGGGEHLLHQASLYPQNAYIGVEPFINSMSKALRQIEKQQIRNIRLSDQDAVKILDWLPSECLDRIDLLYPDPWPKQRHWKRRFVNDKNLDRFSRVLKPGGMFHFASDIDSYINWTLQHCDRHPQFRWLVETDNDWQKPFENWITTRYEAKAFREGRTPCYLRFERR